MICPYCKGNDTVKRGTRKKKHETVQLFFCTRCHKKFTPGFTKHKTFPAGVILTALSLYNKLLTLEEAAARVSRQFGMSVSPQVIRTWLTDYADYLPFLRMRDFIKEKYNPKDVLAETRLFHEQIYDFAYHRAKTDCILQEEFRHQRFSSLKDFLELVIAECPHQVFRESSKRASEYRDSFNLDGVRFVRKTNSACRLARLVVDAVANPKLRHQMLERFLLLNDSVTVAVEVPVLLDGSDIRHFQNDLAFAVPVALAEDEVITGHIDIIQIRNGSVHILDYKPSAAKEKPIDQLVLYALALSRLTGLRLYHFKCAWFDEEDYVEFYPLHVVYKKPKRKGKASQLQAAGAAYVPLPAYETLAP